MNTVKVPRRVLEEIEQKVKQSYPLEVFGYLIGTKDKVEKVIWPRQVRDDDMCSPWRGEFERIQKETGGRVAGSIHSHPKCDDPVPSGGDHGDWGDKYYFAIFSVFEENKKKKTNMMWWRPLQELTVVPTGRKKSR
jgi:proteasome lid subunit RPN8/RPN11